MKIFSDVLAEVQHNESVDLETLYHAWFEALKLEGPMKTESVLNHTLGSIGINNSYNCSSLAEELNRKYISEIHLYEGVKELLRELKASGFKLGIITNGPHDTQLGVIKNLKLDTLVDYLFISGDQKIGKRKPDPYIFQYALRVAQKKPEEVLMVGDTLEKDILPAKKLGMHAVFIDRKNESPSAFHPLKQKLSLLLEK